MVANAPSTMLRMVPLPRSAGEDSTLRYTLLPSFSVVTGKVQAMLPISTLILPRSRGRGTAEGGGGGATARAFERATPCPA
jgi:hypothetical protein